MSGLARDNYEFQKVIVVLGFTLMAIKFFAYYLTGSVAILTDAMESIVNVVAACIGIYALYLSAQPPDRSHPYGHGKIEIISSAIEGTMIVIAGLMIIYESAESFLHPGGEIPSLDVGIILVALAAVANYAVGRMAIAKGKKNRSSALQASGHHLCSDTYSSIGIIIGLAVVYVAQFMGYDARWLDSSIAAVFGAIIIVTGLRVIRKSADDTMDRADEDLIREVVGIINEYRHDDWIDLYDLRLIKYGSNIHIRMNVVFPKSMTLEKEYLEASEIDEAVQARFGDSVETAIIPVPCRDYNCRHCQRNCFERVCEFESDLDWSPEKLCNRHPHSPSNKVTFRK